MKSNSPSREEMREEFERMLTALRDRLEQIERRFPEEAAIDKYASVNEAVLDTKIEQLQKSIENLESRILTKWDVATVVFALFSAIGVVAGTIFAVANFVLK
jgi:predicted RNase H-like nuclease (RuvC/YqgF family)